VSGDPFFRSRPALLAFSAIAAGIALTRVVHSAPVVLTFAALFALILSAELAILFRRVPLSRVPIIVLAYLALGVGLVSIPDAQYESSSLRSIAELQPEHVMLSGRVAGATRENAYGSSFLLRTDKLVLDSVRYAVDDLIVVDVSSSDADEEIALPREGDKLTVFSSLEPLMPPTNPDEYSSDVRLHERTGAVCRVHLRTRFDYHIDSASHDTSLWQRATALFISWREIAHGELVDAIHDSTSRSFVSAVVLGERSEISDGTLSDFTQAGVSHILAVSGFNVAIVSLVIAGLLKLFAIHQRMVRLVISMIGVAIYCLIVGLEPSVVRALIMIELYFLARIVERKPDGLNIVASAALITLLVQPYDLFDAGFQLSYSAVFGLAILYPELKRLFIPEESPLSKPITLLVRGAELLLLSVAAAIATMPVTLLQFHRFSLVGVFANIPIVPISSVITSLGFLVIPLNALSHWLGIVYGDALAAMTRFLLWLTHFSASLPNAAIPLRAPGAMCVVLFVLATIFAARAASMRLAALRMSCAFVIAAMLTSFGIPFAKSTLIPNGKLSMLFFDVGQGDCILIRSPEGETCMLDFGGVTSGVRARADRDVLPFLQTEGVNRLQFAMLSHTHLDHFGGLFTMLPNIPLGTLYHTGEHAKDAIVRYLDRQIRASQVNTARLSTGDTLHLGDSVVIYVLHPGRNLVDRTGPSRGNNLNNGSLAVKIVYGKTSALLLGDVESSDEDLMVKEYGKFLKSDLVKVAHHGSRTSSSTALVELARPNCAVISVGRHNVFGHPAIQTLHRWKAVGAAIARTDRDGAVLFQSDGERVIPVNWRQ
jgi:competence protein ComEC